MKKEKKNKDNKNKKFSIFKFLLKWGFVSFVLLLIVSIITLVYFNLTLPKIDFEKKSNNVEILYSNDNIINIYSEDKIGVVNYAEFPLHLIDALLATEDKYFFKHKGFNIISIGRAFLVNIKAGYVKQGGSTITQQLSKMILNDYDKKITRKIRELILSLKLEKNLTKEEILKMYFNTAYFGAGQYGIKNASSFYFDKEVYELTLEESAMLVGLLKAPTTYSPHKDFSKTTKRTEQIIENMYNADFISENDYNKYLKGYIFSVAEANSNSNESFNQELYFADYIKKQIKDYTKEGNIKIKTTLNQEIQDSIEKSTISFIEEEKEDLKNSQIAVIVMGKNGEILGMTGGINYNKTPFNRSLYAYRQSGSAFKLFVFLAGIREENFAPYTLFIDEPIAVGNWFPDNYGNKYYGEVDMRTAFAKSLNSVAVQISEFSKVQNVAKLARKMGITSKIDADDPTIALGTTEINLLELVASYSTITNDGYAVLPYSIQEIVNQNDGEIIYARQGNNKIKILDETEVKYMKEMMYETIISGTAKNAQIPELILSGEEYIGGKTGTSQNYADAWFVGYADDLTIGVWIGNDDNKSMNRITGGSLPSQLWKDIVKNINMF